VERRRGAGHSYSVGGPMASVGRFSSAA
jgi:hypothetical protein